MDKAFGTVQTLEAAALYTEFGVTSEALEVKLIACLAHIRRGFTDSLKLGPCRDAELIVRLFKQLYRIEGELRKKKAGPALRESVRT